VNGAATELVIFDGDGVLINTEDIAVDIDVRVLAALGWEGIRIRPHHRPPRALPRRRPLARPHARSAWSRRRVRIRASTLSSVREAWSYVKVLALYGTIHWRCAVRG
jgi:beta-phosphoglucomutase-like phosphatase (HAD superfamily)